MPSYRATERRMAAMPRSKRQQNVPMVRDVAGSVPAASEELWRRGTDEDGVEYVGTPHAAEIRKRLRIVDETGTVYGTISIDESGRFLFDKGIVSKEDVVAYGASGDDVQTVTEMVEAYLAEHGGVGGGGIEGIELVLNSTDYKLQAKVTNQDGDEITSNVVDFPIESVVVDGEFDAVNQNIVLTLKNGSQVTFSVGDLVRGLASTGYVDSAVGGKADSSSAMLKRGYINSGDLDSYRDNAGTYGCDFSNVTNKPTGAYNWGDLIVTGWNSYTSSQIYIPDNDSGIYVRTYWNGAWKAWRKIALTSDITKSAVGLGNVDNTSDANKPISTATQTALDGKLSKSGGTLTGDVSINSGKWFKLNGSDGSPYPNYGIGWVLENGKNVLQIRNWGGMKLWSNPTNGGSISVNSWINLDGIITSPNGMEMVHPADAYLVLGYGTNLNSNTIDSYLDGTNIHFRHGAKKTYETILRNNGSLQIVDLGYNANNTKTQMNGGIQSDSAVIGIRTDGATYRPHILSADGNIVFGMSRYDSNKWAYLGCDTNGNVTLKSAKANAGSLKIDTSGNCVASGDVTAYSDRRLKSDIKELEYRGPLEPKEYVKDGKKSIGFIAQEVREKYPELVQGEEKEDEYLSLNYGAITAVLAAENKGLRKRIERLEMLINKLMEE